MNTELNRCAVSPWKMNTHTQSVASAAHSHKPRLDLLHAQILSITFEKKKNANPAFCSEFINMQGYNLNCSNMHDLIWVFLWQTRPGLISPCPLLCIKVTVVVSYFTKPSPLKHTRKISFFLMHKNFFQKKGIKSAHLYFLYAVNEKKV